MTAFAIILEMTGDGSSAITVMLAAIVGFGTARLVSGALLDYSLSRNLLADVLRRSRADETRSGA